MNALADRPFLFSYPQTPKPNECVLLPSSRRARLPVELERANTSLKQQLAEVKQQLAEARTQADEKDAKIALIQDCSASATLWPEEKAHMMDQIASLSKASLEKEIKVRLVCIFARYRSDANP